MRKFVLAMILLSTAMSFASPNGFKIIQLEPGSIYEKLGLKVGDVVTDVNGKDPKSNEDQYSWLSAAKPGDTIDVKIERNQERKTLHYTVK
jgi:general secretion pathway protein C